MTEALAIAETVEAAVWCLDMTNRSGLAGRARVVLGMIDDRFELKNQEDG